MLQIGAIGILNEAAYVAISIAQVLGESVGREEVETIGKPFVQRCLEGIVEHLQLWEVEQQYRRHVGLLIEISSPKVRKRAAARGSRPAEIGVENLRCLVEVTSLMVPQMVSPSTYVADLSDPVLSELMLHVEIPLHNDRDSPPGTGSLHSTENID